jgi:transposase
MRNSSIRKLLKTPDYKITEIMYNTNEIHVSVEPYIRKKFICSGCGEIHITGYHSKRTMIAEDNRLGHYRVFLHIVKRRYRCPKDNRIRTEHLDWIAKRSRVTKAFAHRITDLTALTTNTEAGWFFGLDDQKVYRIDKEYLQQQAAKRLSPIPYARNMSVDEVSYRKYHRYLTNVVDLDKKLIIWNEKGRKKEILDQYYHAIGTSKCAQIESVALDGARTYISSTIHNANNAFIVYDRFHATQKINTAVERVRKDELAKARKQENQQLIQLTNCKMRFMLIKRKNKLTATQATNLETLCRLNEPIYKAVLLKESFLQVYDCADEQEATEHLNTCIQQAIESGLAVFIKLAEKLQEKAQYILNWFKKKISSAISEGINNKIKRLQRMAYGYKDIEYLKLKIHQHCGLLNPRLAT